MSFLGRVAALGTGTIDRVLTRAEQAVGLRAPDPVPVEAPREAPAAPFFPVDYDWRLMADELSKSARPAIATGIEALPDPSDAPTRAPRALKDDPFQMVELLGWKERPSGLAYTVLEQVVRRTPPIKAMHLVRVSQAKRHCRVQEDSHQIGFRVKHRDKKTNLSRAARRQAQEMELALLKTTRGDVGIGRSLFGDFTAACIKDSLTYDQTCFEVIYNRRGQPHSWYAADAKTIRLADSSNRFIDKASNSAIRTVQILNGQVINEWSAAEMAFAIRNRDTSIQSQGYGTSEIEMMIHVITAMLWAFDYNKRFFSQGAAPKGLLNFKGKMPGFQLAAFRRFFYQMIAGVENAWKTPIVNAETGVEWVSMQSTNRDMEYSAWYDFLLKLSSAMYLMDPMEIGFKYGNENDRSLFESANEQKVTQSKDKGLKPLMTWWGEELNRYIIHPWDPDFSVEFLGLEALSPKEQADLDEVRGRTYMMVDELRASEGLAPLPDGEGQVLTNSSWLQYKQQKDAAAQQAQAGAEGEGEGEGGAQENDQGGDQGSNLESLFARMDQQGQGPIKKSLTTMEF